MNLLLAGVLLWTVVHFIPGLMPNIKTAMVEKLGKGYRGVFSLLIVCSVIMMVMGWKSTVPELLYTSINGAFEITAILMVFSLYLLGSAHGEANIKRYIHHPMLCGVIVWGIAHLISNGDTRSFTLFGGLAIWAAMEIIIINKRDGEWEKPAPVPLSKDAKKLAAALVLYVIIVFAHPYIAGVPVIM